MSIEQINRSFGATNVVCVVRVPVQSTDAYAGLCDFDLAGSLPAELIRQISLDQKLIVEDFYDLVRQYHFWKRWLNIPIRKSTRRTDNSNVEVKLHAINDRAARLIHKIIYEFQSDS